MGRHRSLPFDGLLHSGLCPGCYERMLSSKLLPTTTRSACQARAPGGKSACLAPPGFPQPPTPHLRLVPPQVPRAHARLQATPHKHPLRVSGSCPEVHRAGTQLHVASNNHPLLTSGSCPQVLRVLAQLLVASHNHPLCLSGSCPPGAESACSAPHGFPQPPRTQSRGGCFCTDRFQCNKPERGTLVALRGQRA